MSYGLRVTGTGGIYQLDSETSSTLSLVLASSGTTTSNNQQLSGDQSGDLIFARPSGTSNTDFFYNGVLKTFSVPTTYKLIRAADSNNITTTGDYGLTVTNLGGTKIFDSRGMASSVVFTNIYQEGQFDGGKRFGTGYQTSKNEVLNLNSDSDHTAYDNTYILMNAGFYLNPSNSQAVRINGYYFDRTNKYIYFQSYFEETAVNTPIYQVYPNYTAVIVGSLTL